MKFKPLLHLLALGAALVSTMAGAQAASVSGFVFFDLNGNGARDAVAEYGLPQWSLQLVPVSPAGPTIAATTDVNGRFDFGSLAAGDYTLAAVNPVPWLQTHPVGAGTYSITLLAGDTVAGRDFACKQPANVPQIVWQKTLGGIGEDYRAATRQTADGGYIIGASSTSIASGVKTSPNYGGWDYWVVRLDAAGNQLWDRSFGGPGHDFLNSIKQTADGGFILAGISDSPAGGSKTSPNYGSYDYWIVRLDAAGNKLWERTLGGTSHELMRADSILELHAGGFLVGGSSASEVSASGAEGNKSSPRFGGDRDGWLVWLDANGNQVRDRSYGGGRFDQTCSALENADGTLLIGGLSNSEATSGADGNKTSPNRGGNADYWLFKINAVGDLIWDKSYGGGGQDSGSGFVPLPDGNLALTGYSAGSGVSGNKTAADQGGPGNPQDFWIVKVDANGDVLSDKTYGGDGYDQMGTATVMADGNVLLAGGGTSGISGNKVSPAFGNWDSEVMLIAPDGVLLWDVNLGGPGDDEDCAATATADGGALVTRLSLAPFDGGNVTGALYGHSDISLIKLAPLSCTANPLTIVSATADCGQHKITVNFSAPLDPATALQAAHYTLSGGAASVQAAHFGESTLTVVLDAPGLAAGVTYTLAVAGLSDDCGHALAPGAQLAVACPGEIRGRVFNDRNNNCAADAAEFTLMNWPVKLEPGPRYTLTDRQGNYSFAAPAGTYTLSAPASPLSPWNLTCPAGPGTRQVSVTNGQIAAGADFGARSKSSLPCADLWVDVTAYYPGPKDPHRTGASTPCCGSNFIYTLNFGNNGANPSTTPASITFYLSGQCSFVAASPPSTALWTVIPPANSGDPVVVLFNQSVPASGYQDSVNLEVSLACDPTVSCDEPEQELLADAAFVPIFPWQGECDNPWTWANNYSEDSVTPCCSFDPNDCTVEPQGCGPEGYVNRDQTLTYLVRFQNIGAGRAHQVIVRNDVDADLDLDTLEIVGTSHPNLLERNGRELKWIFPDIELASAGVDEAASHGYVKFRLRPRADAPAGTVLNHSAEIFFDYNAPITTIATINTITDNPLPVAAFRAVPQRGSAGRTNDFLYTGGTPGAQFRWHFGPHAIPQTSTATNPTGIIFTRPGRHLVSLRVAVGDCVVPSPVKVITVGQPRLGITKTGSEVALSWQGDGFVVQEADSLTAPIQWQFVPAQPLAVAGWNYITLPAGSAARFYRLAETP